MMDRGLGLLDGINLCGRIGIYCTLTGVALLYLAPVALLWAGVEWLITGSGAPIRVDSFFREVLHIHLSIYGRIGWAGLRMIIEWFVSLPLYAALLVLVPVLFASGWTLDKISAAQDRRAR